MKLKLPIAYASGLLFGLGISLSGMANPAKVINFFDVFGSWDPSLAFVMGGGVVVTFFGYRLTHRRNTSLIGANFSLPTRSDIDSRLVTGSLLFGVGWGIAGFCPGGALPMLGTGNSEVIIFCMALFVGVFLANTLTAVLSKLNDSENHPIPTDN